MPMPAPLNNAVNRFKDSWSSMSTSQRVLSAGGAVVLLAAIIGLSIYATRPDYRVLYSNLSGEDANRVLSMLKTEKVPYKLADNGTTVMVPQEVVYDQRIKIAGFRRINAAFPYYIYFGCRRSICRISSGNSIRRPFSGQTIHMDRQPGARDFHACSFHTKLLVCSDAFIFI